MIKEQEYSESCDELKYGYILGFLSTLFFMNLSYQKYKYIGV